VRVVVVDDGPGVEANEQEGLFDLFARGSSRGEASTGVGLAFCRRVIDRHGAEIGIERSAEGGAAFWFTLPAADQGDAMARSE